jgi:hypothetical protein
MGEVIQFVAKSERERLRLIAEARGIYESIFPPAAEKAPVGRLIDAANPRRADAGAPSSLTSTTPVTSHS